MVVRILDVARDPFRPKEDEKEALELKVLYLSAIGILLYLLNTLEQTYHLL